MKSWLKWLLGATAAAVLTALGAIAWALHARGTAAKLGAKANELADRHRKQTRKRAEEKARRAATDAVKRVRETDREAVQGAEDATGRSPADTINSLRG